MTALTEAQKRVVRLVAEGLHIQLRTAEYLERAVRSMRLKTYLAAASGFGRICVVDDVLVHYRARRGEQHRSDGLWMALCWDAFKVLEDI